MMKKAKGDSTHNIAMGTAVIVIVMVIVFSAIFYWMWSVDMLFLPSFVEDMLGIGKENEDPVWDLGALSSLVKDGKSESGENVVLDITYENLRDAFLSKKVEQGVYITADVKYFANGEEFVKRIVYSRDGERFRVEQHYIASQIGTDSQIEMLKISDGETLYTHDYSLDKSNTLPIANDISPENEAGIPSVDTLIELVGSYAFDGTSSDGDTPAVVDTQLKLLTTDNGNVYYISYTYSDIDLTEEYYVSLDQRMIIFAKSKQNGKDIYSYELLGFSTDVKSYSDDSLYTVSKSDE